MTEAIKIYTEIVTGAIPFAMAFAVGNLIVTSFMKMAFKGRIEF